MTEQEARRLLPMTVVFFNEKPYVKGTVIKIGCGGFFVNWEDGQSGWITFASAEKIKIY